MKEMLLLLDANAALVASVAGLLLISAEFCLPGGVIPGVMGGVFLVCGVHRLAMLDASATAAAGVTVALLGAALAGYGRLPEWAALPLILGVPWLCRALAPGAIQWPAATLALAPPVTLYFLLRIAARAAANKTLLQ